MKCRSRGRRMTAAMIVWIALLSAAGLAAAEAWAVSAHAASDPAGASPASSGTSQESVEAPAAPEPTFFEWMEKARAGDVDAQCNVGVFYVNGQGVPRDYKEGIAWLYKAGNLGSAHAQFLLASLYSQGFGETLSDPAKTWFWAALAAANNSLPEPERQRAVKMMSAGEKYLTAQQLAKVQQSAKDWWEGRAQAPR